MKRHEYADFTQTSREKNKREEAGLFFFEFEQFRLQTKKNWHILETFGKVNIPFHE